MILLYLMVTASLISSQFRILFGHEFVIVQVPRAPHNYLEGRFDSDFPLSFFVWGWSIADMDASFSIWLVKALDLLVE